MNEAVHPSMSVSVCVCAKPSSIVWLCWLTGRLCHLTSALGQRAKVISLSQPKVSGKARNPARGTVGYPPPLPTPFPPLLSNQSDLSNSSVSVSAIIPGSVLVFCRLMDCCACSCLPQSCCVGVCVHAAPGAAAALLSDVCRLSFPV